jgi:uncharacterized membrane protein
MLLYTFSHLILLNMDLFYNIFVKVLFEFGLGKEDAMLIFQQRHRVLLKMEMLGISLEWKLHGSTA